MLDKIENRIATTLSEHHFYPYSREIYINIFRHFSHFPIRLTDLSIKGEGETITFLAYVAMYCLRQQKGPFLPFYRRILGELKIKVAPYFPFNIAVETYLGCILYYYHPVDIRSTLTSFDNELLFNTKEKYEYDLKKKTLLIHAI